MAGKTLAMLAFVAAVQPAAAQSLGEVAKAEAQRRTTAGKATRVYTNESLRPEPQPEVPLPSAAPAADGLAVLTQSGSVARPADAAQAVAAMAPAPSAGTPQAGTPAAAASAKPGSEPSSESEWRTRAADLRGQVVRQRILADALQSRINALRTDFVNRDDPAQRAVIEQDRVKALAELERVKKDLKSAEQAVTDLDDQARRKSVPAGWLR